MEALLTTKKKTLARKFPFQDGSYARKSKFLGGGGGGGGWGVCQPISPHYRSEGHRLGLCAVLGGYLGTTMVYGHLYHICVNVSVSLSSGVHQLNYVFWQYLRECPEMTSSP